MNEKEELRFRLDLGERTIEATAFVPVAPVRVVDLLPLMFSFTEAVVAAAAHESETAGKKISCRAGCGACCRQLVPISHSEARYLAERIEEMPQERREQVKERFRRAVEELDRHGMLARTRDSSSPMPREERVKLGLEYFALGIPCPFLEEESCSIHPTRPAACREYLVTSPAENCSHPTAQNIEMVQIALKPSRTLARFDSGVRGDDWQPIPLVLSLEWVAEHAGDPQPELPGRQMFENFLTGVAAG